MYIDSNFPTPWPLRVRKKEPSKVNLVWPVLPPKDSTQHIIDFSNNRVHLIVSDWEFTSMWMGGHDRIYVLERFEDMIFSLVKPAQEYGIPVNETETRTRINPFSNSIADIYSYYLWELDRFEAYVDDPIIFADVLTSIIHQLIVFPFWVKQFYGDLDFYSETQKFLVHLDEKVRIYSKVIQRTKQDESQYNRWWLKELFHSLIWHFTPDEEDIIHQQIFSDSDINKFSPDELFHRLKASYLTANRKWSVHRKIWEDSVRLYGRWVRYSRISSGHGYILQYMEKVENTRWGPYCNFLPEFFEKANTFDWFLDLVAESHTQTYLRSIHRFIERSPERSAVYFSAKEISIVTWHSGFIDSSETRQRAIVYWYIRDCIMGRGLPLPRIEPYKNQRLSNIFSEQTEWVLEKWEVPEADIPHPTQDYQKHFWGEIEWSIPEWCHTQREIIHYIIGKSGQDQIDLSVSKHLLWYIEQNKSDFSSENVIDILHTITENEWNWFFYFLLTENNNTLRDLLEIIFWKTTDLNIAEIYEKNKNCFNNERIQAIFWAIWEHFSKLEKQYFWNLGFLMYVLIKDSWTSKIDNLKDFCDKFIDYLVEDWWKFAYQNWVLVFSNTFENENSLVVSQVKAQVESCLLWDQNERISLLHSWDFFQKLWTFIDTVLTVSESNNESIWELKNAFYKLCSDATETREVSRWTLKIHRKWTPTQLIPDSRREIQPLVTSSLQSGRKISEEFDKNTIPWAFPIWWKVHFTDPLQPITVEMLKEISGITATPFKLLEQDTSLCLPACNSPLEIMNIIYQFSQLWVINQKKPELQLSVAGRIPNHHAAILWSTMLFLKPYKVYYPESAFATTHDNLTQRCILCYDSWVLNTEGFPQLPTGIAGRTDILGIRDISEVVSYYLLWNLISQSYWWWALQEAWLEFIKLYLELLEENGLSHLLEGKWVHDPQQPKGDNNNEDYIRHSMLVNSCTEIRNLDLNRLNEKWIESWISFEVKKILQRIIQKYNLNSKSEISVLEKNKNPWN